MSQNKWTYRKPNTSFLWKRITKLIGTACCWKEYYLKLILFKETVAWKKLKDSLPRLVSQVFILPRPLSDCYILELEKIRSYTDVNMYDYDVLFWRIWVFLPLPALEQFELSVITIAVNTWYPQCKMTVLKDFLTSVWIIILSTPNYHIYIISFLLMSRKFTPFKFFRRIWVFFGICQKKNNLNCHNSCN